MIDQSHNVEGKIDAMIQSVMNIQTAYAKALLVDERAARGGAARGRRARRAPRPARGVRDRRAPAARAAARGARRRAGPGRGVPRGRVRRAARAPSAARLGRERVRASSDGGSAVRVALFITCLGDTLLPEAGRATVAVLERLGHEVVFPAGADLLRPDAPEQRLPRRGAAARRAGSASVFERYEAVVSPSLVAAPAHECREHVPAARRGAACTSCRSCSSSGSASRTSARRSRTASPTTRPATRCGSLRVGDAPLRLLRRVRGLELVELPRADECCGFGGTFAIKNADTSSAMLADKCDAIDATGAEVCTAVDASCLMHIGGGLSRERPACAPSTSPRSSPRDEPATNGFPDAARVELGERAAARNLATRRTRSATSAHASSPRCPTGRSCARPAARSRPTCSPPRRRTCSSSRRRSTRAGGTVHWARDAAEANAIVVEVVRAHGATRWSR